MSTHSLLLIFERQHHDAFEFVVVDENEKL